MLFNKRSIIYLYLLVFILILTSILFLSNEDLQIIAKYITLDKYQISNNVYRYIFIIFSLIISSLFILISVRSKEFLITPTILFFGLLVFLVLPGVILTSEDSINGEISANSYIFGLLFFSLGVFFVTKLLRFNSYIEIGRFKSKKSKHKKNLNNTRVSIFKVFMFIGILMSVLYIIISPRGTLIAIESLFDFFSSGNIDSAQGLVQDERVYRYVFGLSYLDLIYIYIVRLVLPIIIASLIFKLKKNTVIFLFILLFISVFGTGSRLLTAHLFLFFLIFYSVYNDLKVRSIIRLFIIIGFILVFQTIVLGRLIGSVGYLESSLKALNTLLERIFLTKGYVTSQVFYYFPDLFNFRLGQTIIPTLFGTFSNTTPFSQEMFALFADGSSGTAGPQAFGELYVNFGFSGVMIGSFLLGFIIQYITIKLIRGKKHSPYNSAIYSYITLLFGLVGYSGLLAFKSYGGHILFIFYSVTALLLMIFKRDKIINPAL